MIEADVHIVAKHVGIEVECSDRLEWVTVNGEMKLTTMRRHPASGRVVVYTEAMNALYEDAAVAFLPEMLRQAKNFVAGGAGDHRYAGGGQGSPADRSGNIPVAGAGAGDGLLIGRASHDVSDEPRDDHGRWTDGGGGGDDGSFGFVSPNVRNDLTLAGAERELSGEAHAALRQACSDIDNAIGIKSHDSDVIGAWADGAENSVMSRSTADWDHLVLAEAMKGHIADQKSVLAFKVDPAGSSVLASFDAPGDLKEIHLNLLQDGLAFHTLVPHKDGATVYVADLDGTSIEAIRKGAERYGSTVEIRFGRGEFIGNPEGEGDTDRAQRDSARRVYERVIDESPVQGSRDIWGGIRDTWGKAPDEVTPEGPTLHDGPMPSQTLTLDTPGYPDLSIPPRTAEVLINPTEHDVTDQFHLSEHSTQEVRWMIDIHNNLFTRVAGDAIHQQVRDALAGLAPDIKILDFDTEPPSANGGPSKRMLERIAKGQEAAKRYAKEHGKVLRAGHDVSDEPRDDHGRWTDGGGDDEAGASDEATATAQSQEPGTDVGTEGQPNKEAMDVGGDAWNKETAERLENEYAAQKTDLIGIANEAVGRSEEQTSELTEEEKEDLHDNAPMVPEEWDMMTGDQQEDAEGAYKEHSYTEVYDSEVQNWQENDAKRDALQEVASGSDDEWLMTALKENFTFKGEDREEIAFAGDEKKPIASKIDLPFSFEDIAAAITVDFDEKANHYEGGLDISIQDSVLDSKIPVGFETGQSDLPGIESAKPSEYLTDDMRTAIVDAIEKAGEKEAEDLVYQGKIEPPEYLADSAKEWLEESWDQMSDKEKFNWVTNNTSIVEDAQKEYDQYYEENGKEPELIKIGEIPEYVDPLNETSGTTYKQTQALAKFMSRERAAELLVERGCHNINGVPFASVEKARNAVENVDNAIWSAWKSSSASSAGWMLQVAAHDELGGRLHEHYVGTSGYGSGVALTHAFAVEYANENYDTVGGFEGVKALIRAKWETTQFLLDRAGMQVVDAYRGLRINAGPLDEDGRVKDFTLKRNGAQSMTTDISVAQRFAGSSGTVIRLEVPRTAVISVPAYGQNIYSEHEIVVAGTAWRAWDAWQSNKAPHLDAVPVKFAPELSLRALQSSRA